MRSIPRWRRCCSTDQGFAVDTAENGLRALEIFSKSEPGYYDAILMDIRMPIMDGLSATVNIRHLSNPDARDYSDYCHDGQCL